MNENNMTMRDAFISRVYDEMHTNQEIYFLSGDFGAPMLDRLRDKFPDRFINVGIAEQNLINVATGIALEGYTVFVYFIAPFVMRAYEQVRINLSMTSAVRKVNVNMIGVGCGLSYEVSGPTHHCLEDIAIMRLLPNVKVFSPSDWPIAQQFVNFALRTPEPKYLRFDGKPLPPLSDRAFTADFDKGFRELAHGENICIVATGCMSHTAIDTARALAEEGIKIGVVDMFMLKPVNEPLLLRTLQGYRHVITMEEAFTGNGGLDCIVSNLIQRNKMNASIHSVGITDGYVFDIGDRSFLHKLHGMDRTSLTARIKALG